MQIRFYSIKKGQLLLHIYEKCLKTRGILMVVLLFGTWFGSGCSKDEYVECPESNIDFESLSFEPSMKGWNIYSWKDGNARYYSVVRGTNRMKTCDEIKENDIAVEGTRLLKRIIDKLPEGDYIGWHNGLLDCSFSDPSDQTINEIERHWRLNGLKSNI